MMRFYSKISRIFQTFSAMNKIAWRAHRRSYIGLLLTEGFQGLIPLASAWIIKLLFDLLANIFQSRNYSQLPKSLILLLGAQAMLSIFLQLASHWSTFLNAELERRLTLSTQLTTFEKIISLQGLAPFENPRFHDYISLAQQGAQMGPSQIINILTNLVRNLLLLVSFIGVLVIFSPIMAGLVALASLPQLFLEIKMGNQRYIISFQNTSKERLAGYYGFVLSSAQLAKEIRLFNLGEYFLKKFRSITLEVQNLQRNQQSLELRWQSLLSLLFSLVSSGTFMVVVIRAFLGGFSLGDVTLYTSAVSNVQAAFSGIIFALTNFNESVLYFSRYTDLLALKQSISIPLSPCPTPSLGQSIEFRNVSFRYSDESPWILRNFSFLLPAGKCLALVGLNGAGKTTLVKLLTRMYDPTEGYLLWDGIDIREFDPIDLRHRIGAIFQDFARFELTAQENIALGDVAQLSNGNDQALVDAVHQAANKAGIHDKISSLPQGYMTNLSRWLSKEGLGVDLSGGEWQKVALARMFMRNADLLILDEPSAALDAQAEYGLYNHFIELLNGKTSLLISHRFSTVRMANVIAVLENGKISEYGSHEQLLSFGGTYSRLYNMQADRYK